MTKTGMCWQILEKCPNIKFNKNPFQASPVTASGLRDIVKLIGTAVYAPKNSRQMKNCLVGIKINSLIGRFEFIS
jgi:hypothetical protein